MIGPFFLSFLVLLWIVFMVALSFLSCLSTYFGEMLLPDTPICGRYPMTVNR
ncbi:hypothetical protein M430DRAFT_35089 [Amorphotheca resinae ATCC 22711]|uniref:Uncharacterized protein n=1 Tax=Amorphotheca resinae ATCC 22711 TaxID=857342 RepID=A0A2T3B242_AMORE|nr:hypothetical protein M430DRAFT_35089 [Amorphotheca resinae ATCC 22711]PSS18613.1 hypothetical protein M430DRAFT_35089 [Amorphotheca resinae ATCC 22711]